MERCKSWNPKWGKYANLVESHFEKCLSEASIQPRTSLTKFWGMEYRLPPVLVMGQPAQYVSLRSDVTYEQKCAQMAATYLEVAADSSLAVSTVVSQREVLERSYEPEFCARSPTGIS